jgi:hypothetical protein
MLCSLAGPLVQRVYEYFRKVSATKAQQSCLASAWNVAKADGGGKEPTASEPSDKGVFPRRPPRPPFAPLSSRQTKNWACSFVLKVI